MVVECSGGGAGIWWYMLTIWLMIRLLITVTLPLILKPWPDHTLIKA